jgi:hypothetical protein
MSSSLSHAQRSTRVRLRLNLYFGFFVEFLLSPFIEMYIHERIKFNGGDVGRAKKASVAEK